MLIALLKLFEMYLSGGGGPFWSIYKVKLENYKCILLVFSVPGGTCVHFVHKIGIWRKGWKALYLYTNVMYKSVI